MAEFYAARTAKQLDEQRDASQNQGDDQGQLRQGNAEERLLALPAEPPDNVDRDGREADGVIW